MLFSSHEPRAAPLLCRWVGARWRTPLVDFLLTPSDRRVHLVPNFIDGLPTAQLRLNDLIRLQEAL